MLPFEGQQKDLHNLEFNNLQPLLAGWVFFFVNSSPENGLVRSVTPMKPSASHGDVSRGWFYLNFAPKRIHFRC